MSPRRSTDVEPPWCSICGRHVTIVRQTMDARHPLGECHYVDAQGFSHGHGKVPAILDADELRAALNRHARERAWKRHAKHLAATEPVRGCTICADIKREQTTIPRMLGQ